MRTLCRYAPDIPLRMKLVECGATYVQTRGPRFETKAEIRALGVMGGDVVGMTGVSEVGGMYYSCCMQFTHSA
jgi:5'-methylthioadenosine phosphorylase